MNGFIARLAGAGPAAWAVLALGVAAAVLMVAAELATIQSVRIGESTCGAAEADVQELCQTSGGSQHGYALLVLALFTAVLAYGAAIGRSRPAAVALMVVGFVVIAIALLLDRPALDDTRGLEARYADVRAETGPAYALEIVAGALTLAAAGAALGWERLSLPARRRRRERAAA